VSNATLNRFFSLHYLLPFVLAALAAMHLLALHQHGSSKPLGACTSAIYPSYGCTVRQQLKLWTHS
jgi:quinol-cytochrome oxidoreductase complex cytochrome b subunit